nr:hypothetical protein [Acidobacteriota bacterium]
MQGRKLFSIFAAFLLFIAASFAVNAAAASDKSAKESSEKSRVDAPVNLAILIQDDLVSRVGNELDVTRNFIRTLPKGSRVMVAYVTSGALQVRQ